MDEFTTSPVAVAVAAFAPVWKPIHMGIRGDPGLLIVVQTVPSTVNSTLSFVRRTPQVRH